MRSLAVILLLLFFASGSLAQPPDHAKHHPGGSEGSPGPKGPAGMMDGGMDGMMEKMGAPKPKDLYPTLMRTLTYGFYYFSNKNGNYSSG